METVQIRITSTVPGMRVPYGAVTVEAVFSGAGSALTMDVGRESLERIA